MKSFQTTLTFELIPHTKGTFFLSKWMSEGETIWQLSKCRFKWFYWFGKRKYLNNIWRDIFLDCSDDAILILQNKKITTCDDPECVAGANKSQTTYEKIYHSSWFNSANLFRVLCLGIYLYYSFLGKLVFV